MVNRKHTQQSTFRGIYIEPMTLYVRTIGTALTQYQMSVKHNQRPQLYAEGWIESGSGTDR